MRARGINNDSLPGVIQKSKPSHRADTKFHSKCSGADRRGPTAENGKDHENLRGITPIDWDKGFTIF